MDIEARQRMCCTVGISISVSWPVAVPCSALSNRTRARDRPASASIHTHITMLRFLAPVLLLVPTAVAFRAGPAVPHSALRQPQLSERSSRVIMSSSYAALETVLRSIEEPVPAAQITDLVAATEAPATWVQKLNKISTFASILCAIDCTVFPILLALLPLAGFAPAGLSAWIHKAAHAVAIWFVAPVGGGAVISNWFQHKKPLVGLWGMSGVALVLLANIHLPHAILGWHVPHALEHSLHANHRLINVAGCALLLSSQRYAHNLLEKMGVCCGHDHGHSHSHSHSHSH